MSEQWLPFGAETGKAKGGLRVRQAVVGSVFANSSGSVHSVHFIHVCQ